MEILYSQRGDYLILFPWEEIKREALPGPGPSMNITV